MRRDLIMEMEKYFVNDLKELLQTNNILLCLSFFYLKFIKIAVD